MPTAFVLSHDIVFDDVPVKTTVRGFSIACPAVLRVSAITGKENHSDKEWDGRSAPFTWDKTKSEYAFAKMSYKAQGKAGVTKTVLSLRVVTKAEYDDRMTAWCEYLVDNADDWTNTYQHVVASVPNSNLRRRALHHSAVPIPAPVVPTPVVVPVQQAAPAVIPQWDPDDIDIAQDLFEVPQDNPAFLPDPETFQILDAQAKLALENNEPRMILIYGDTSTGKTEHPLIWAARRDWLHCRIDCGAFGEIYDVTGPIKAVEKNGASYTEWVRGKTIRAMADPRPAVIQLDEVNRISDVKAMNILFPFLDSARQSYFDDAQAWMKLNGVKLIVATMNGDTRGDDIGEYVGTQPLDQAFVSRFPVRRQLRYPDAQKLAKILTARSNGTIGQPIIDTIAQIAVELAALNKFVPNLRELFAAMDFLAQGVDLFHALKWTVGGIYKDDGTSACDYISFKGALTGKGINTDEA